jgi:CelD/BcsL family acetyltransferase involved in cellulose biosynthesis
MRQTAVCNSEHNIFEDGMMAEAVTRETFESLDAIQSDPRSRLRWTSPFVLPLWLKAWWQSFGCGRPEILAVRRRDQLIGVAPLMIHGNTARLIGDVNVCDHLDIITAPQEAEVFSQTLGSHLRRRGVDRLDLELLRPDSTVLCEMAPAARRQGLRVEITPQDTSLELALPESWESYLTMLSGKQRHELRRKLRRLAQAAPHAFRTVSDKALVSEAMEVFFELFRSNRTDKADFMQEPMIAYFQRLTKSLAEEDRLRLFFLEVQGVPAAAAMCFHHRGTMYLYNSAYDGHYQSLSAGIICKALSIRESIRSGMKVYDLLRGTETYKRHLGGKPVTLFRCTIEVQ